MIEIEAERIRLRGIRPEDNEEIFEYRSNSEVNKYQGFIPKRISDVDEFIQKNPVKFNEPESWFQLVIIDKESNQIIGDIGVHFIGKDGFQCELGCTLSEDTQRKGFATEAMKAVIGYLFNILNKHRIIGSVDPENSNSIHLLERLGFRKEAHFKQSLYLNGKWEDDVVFGLLKSEWKS